MMDSARLRLADTSSISMGPRDEVVARLDQIDPKWRESLKVLEAPQQ